MIVQSERDIKIPNLLDQLKSKIDKCDKFFKTEVNKQLLIDCYDVIKTSASEENDSK